MIASIDPQIELSPRLQAFVDALKQSNVLSIIFSEDAPCFQITIDAGAPELGACVRNLATAAEISSEIVELVAVEFEPLARNFQRINGFERGIRGESVGGESTIDLRNIEAVPIVTDDEVSFIKNLPKVSTERQIAMFVDFIAWIIAETMGLNSFVPSPENSKAEQEGIPLHPDSVSLMELPDGG